MRKGRLLALGSGLLIASVAALYLVHPPGPGHVYGFRTDVYGLAEHTALLLRSGECLVLSRSEEDIGKVVASPDSESRLFTIAGAQGIRSGRDHEGLYLIDQRSGLISRPGLAIDAAIIFDSEVDTFDSLIMGWPLDLRCGSRLAKVLSISRVHR